MLGSTLHIDSLNVPTRFSLPSQREVLTLHSKGEATYNYYEYGKTEKPLGQIRAVKVTIYD